MEHIASKDGTTIAFERSGEGPPLVLVHGTAMDHTYWAHIVPSLESDFTVYAVDRRGRGQSGDTGPYAIEREFEDVAALVDSIPGPVDLLGHSYGALCSLEAALLTTHVHKLALYEPPVHTTVEITYPADILERYDACLEAGDAEKALLMLYEAGQTSADELALLRSLPSWQARILAAPTIPREIVGAKNYAFVPERYSALRASIQFLLGSESSPFYKAATETMHASLPRSRITVLPGQRHEAVLTSPELLLREVVGFLLGNG